jgi:hypothetical protein
MNFQAQASGAYRRGWRSVIPLEPGQKRPAISRWQQTPVKGWPPETLRSLWAQTPGAGCGFVMYGNVLAVDIDIMDPALAYEVVELADEHLGRTPLVRIGQTPKSMRFYRNGVGNMATRRYNGIEVFSRGGQVALFGIHPKTQAPYQWPHESPADVSPGELPHADRPRLKRFLAAALPLLPPVVRGEGQQGGSAGQPISGEIRDAVDALLAQADDPQAAGPGILTAADAGARHGTMFELVRRFHVEGWDMAPLRGAYAAIFAGDTGRLTSFDNAVAWCVAHIEPVDPSMEALVR